MPVTKHINNFFLKRPVIVAAIIISGSCWYLSNGLSGDFWYLLWIAPIPVLLVSFNCSGKMAFIISFMAYLIGRLSWFSYLVTVATLVPAIIFTLLLSLIFALIIVITRQAVIKINSWLTVFAFPVFFTTFEFLLMNFSADGTAGSIAYSQSNFLSLVQIASVTGILGITFIVTFIPSAITVSWHYYKEKNKFYRIIFTAAFIVTATFLYGNISMNNDSQKESIIVGLVVLEEKFHDITNHPDFEKENAVTQYYAGEIAGLSAKGAQVVVLPERAINITKEKATDIIEILSKTAKENHVFIITGYTNFRNDKERNSSLVINTEGNIVTDYDKVHLVKGLEQQFTPGNKIGLFNMNEIQEGTAICKDLDFPGYIKKYGQHNAGILYIPAWDFVTDDWLHSRMAILRGVENGFSEVRTAREGRLTISDCYGRVTYEASCSNGKAATLLGKVSLQKRDTIYTRVGDWFGIMNLIAAVIFIFFLRKNKRKVDSALLIS